MLQMNDHDERTETPTRKRLEDARMNGQAALSQDLVGSVVLGVGAGSVLLFSGSIFSAFLTITRTSLGNFGSLRLNTEAASGLVQRMLEQILQIISPLMLLMLVSAIVMTWLQVGFRIRFSEVLPDLSRIDPVRGASTIFGFEGVGRIMMALLKLVAIGAVLVPGIWGLLERSEEVGSAITTEGFVGLIPVGLLVMKLILQSCGLLLIISTLDWAHRRWVYRRSLMMSRREVEDERKELLGNPQVRRNRREAHKKILSDRALESVSEVSLQEGPRRDSR
ncbi:MAG: EscU/YscU/HrcU family type III secretion system export apparatus switch protein [Planctomycetes bacterium]|nr:EscU/YscU/HrcU family type III secretion system export apparatus switch protein [Planctomycetota bacterium]